MSKIVVFDLEANSLLDATKIHILGWWEGGKEIKTTTNYDEMREVFSQEDVIFVCHNLYMYDFIVVKSLLGVNPNLVAIDTLALSHYIRPMRPSHSLESYQEEVNIAKVKVDNWEDGDIELYTERVIEDVKITVNLFYLFKKEFKDIYGEEVDIIKIMTFLSSYYRDYHVSYYNPFIVKEDLLLEYIEELTALEKERVDRVEALMPPVYEIKQKPKTHKKDGTLSEAGKKWFTLLEEYDLPFESEEAKVIKSPPNASSDDQVKDWLFALGWVPTYFKDGSKGPSTVPQIKTKDKELCPNILKLNIPETAALEDLSIITHRLGNLKRIRDNMIDGKVYADIGGLTNTLRIKHRILVNLTKVSAPYGKYERGVLGCQEDEVLLGSDLISLENMTRTNLVCDIDPTAIEELLDSDFDTHLAIGLVAGLVTEDDISFYKQFKKELVGDRVRFEAIDKIRSKAKVVSYSALYGVGAPKLAKELKVSAREAQTLLDAYWRKNFAVKAFEKTVEIKYVGKQMWVKHPINGLYYSLRSKKDVFSLVNQSFGAYVFKLWVNEIYKQGIGITFQAHDEICLRVKKDKVEDTIKIVNTALEKVNATLNLRVPIKNDVKIGVKYNEVH